MSGLTEPEEVEGIPALKDVIGPKPVRTSDVVFSGRIWDVRRDVVDLGEAGEVTREYIDHPGAVAILALDDEDRVALVHQYRHPVGMTLWELPAGLLDIKDEPPLEAAVRELAEEVDLRAERWDVLIDWMNSPGGTSEALRCFLARGLSEVPDADRHVRAEEEHGMQLAWFPLEDVRDAILQGHLHNPSLVVGVLAACAAREAAWATLRPADAPWPEHPAYR
jgi:ADP-ribose pyrophosphatase